MYVSFQIYLFIIIYSRVTFIHQRGDLCEIIIFSLTVFVPFVVSVHMRKSVKWWRKHDCTSFIDVLSKGFISNSVKGCDFDFCTGGMHNRGGDFLLKCDICHFKSKKSFSLRRRRSENDFFDFLKFKTIHVKSKIWIFSILTVFWGPFLSEYCKITFKCDWKCV